MAKKTTKKKTTALGPALADPGDPLVLPSGEVLQPILPSSHFGDVNRANKIDPVKFRGKKQHNLKDLPAPVGVMHGIAAVMVYSIMNVGDREIADALKCTVSDIERLRAHAAYTEVFEAFFGNVLSAHSDSLMGRIASYSHGALDRVAHLSANAQNEAVSLRASTDLLDRGGLSAKSIDQAGAMKKDTLRIQINRPDGQEAISVTIGGGE